MSACSQTTVQVTARMVGGAPDRRWIQLMIVGPVNQPYSWTPGQGPECRRDSSVVTCWPANEGVRRHLLGTNQGDVLAVRGELALYEGKQAPHAKAPRTHLGVRADHVWLIARFKARAA